MIEIKKIFMSIILIFAVILGINAYHKNISHHVITSRSPAQSQVPIVYDIRGKSSSLTPKEWADLERSRKREVVIAKENPGIVYINGYTSKRICALTFDDGPTGTVMSEILDVLKKNNIKASFFLIGNQVNEYKAVVKRAYDEGNLVLNHSFTHPDFFKLSADSIKKQILDTEDAIYNVTGKRPAILRPPYASLNNTIISTSKDLGYRIAIWSTDTMDWSQKSTENIIKNVVDNVRPGEIIIMHCNDDKEVTVEALPSVISELRAKGYSFVTLDEFLNIRAYK